MAKSLVGLFVVFVIALIRAQQPTFPSPSVLSIDTISPTELQVTLTPANWTLPFGVEVKQRQSPGIVKLLNTSTTSCLVTGLRGNIVYDVRVRALLLDGSWGNYSRVASARTAPAGCSITNSFSTPTFITIFLEQVPGATIWNAEYTDTRTGQITKLVVPTDGPTKTYYVAVLNNLKPDTVYSIRARIEQVLNSVNYTKAQSPYGASVTLSTEKHSVFGRLVLRDRNFTSLISNDTAIPAIESELTHAYRRYSSRVDHVRVLELENQPPGSTLCHYEIVVTGQDPTANGLNLINIALYGEVYHQANVAGTGFYLYIDNQLVGGNDVSLNSNCNWRDDRSWIFHNDHGDEMERAIPSSSDGQNPDTSQKIEFNGRDLIAVRASPGAFFTFSENSVYAIEHDYVVKSCFADTTTLFYDRLQAANNSHTLTENKYTIVYTTGPGPMNNDINSVDNFPIDTTDANVKVRFNHPRVSKAIHYQFLVTYDDVVMTYMERREWEIDNSERIQITTDNYLTRNTAYNLLMNVTTRLANGTTSTSPSSTFQFFTGAPNTTTLRIVEVTDASFKIRWKPSMFATGYVINVRNHTFSQNFTAPISTEYVMEGLLIEGVTYDVTIASFNRFGMSGFSPAKTTRFWWFSGITNSSFALDWLNEPSDLQYEVVTMPTTSNPNNYTSNHVTFVGLDAGIAYRVNVSYLDVSAAWTLLFSTIQITAPNPPVNLAQIFSNVTAVHVEWDAAIGAETYDVRLETVSRKAGDVAQSATTTSLERKFAGLKSGRMYDVQVRSRNQAGSSRFASFIATTVKDIPTITSTSDDLTSSTFTVRWTPALHASNYVVYATNLNTSSMSSYNVTMTSLMLVGLSSGSTYVVSVAALYETGLSQRSRTANQLTIPEAPLAIRVGILARSYGVGIAWDESFGSEHYDVKLRAPRFDHDQVRVTRNQYVFTNICGDARYDLDVWAVNSAGRSVPRHVQFDAGRFVPQGVALVNVTLTSITIEWDGIKCAGEYMTSVTSTNREDKTTVVSDYAESTIGDLDPGVNYIITVQAVYFGTNVHNNVNSNKSDRVYANTAAKNPSALVAEDVTNSSIRVSWTKQNGATLYRVSVYQYEDTISIMELNETVNEVSVRLLDAGQPYNFTLVTISNVSSRLPLYVNRQNATEIEIVTVTDPPSDVTAHDLQGTNVTITWSEPQGAARYVVTITTLTMDGRTPVKNYATEFAQLDITDLHTPSIYYDVTVQAYNSQGRISEKSPGLTIETALPVNGLPIPWWALLAASAAVFIIIVVLISFCLVRRRKSITNAKRYEVEVRRAAASRGSRPRNVSLTVLSRKSQAMSRSLECAKETDLRGLSRNPSRGAVGKEARVNEPDQSGSDAAEENPTRREATIHEDESSNRRESLDKEDNSDGATTTEEEEESSDAASYDVNVRPDDDQAIKRDRELCSKRKGIDESNDGSNPQSLSESNGDSGAGDVNDLNETIKEMEDLGEKKPKK